MEMEMETKTSFSESDFAKKELNLEDQIASMLGNIMDDSDYSEKEDSDIEESKLKKNQAYSENNKNTFEPRIKIIEAKKFFKEEPVFDKFYSNNNLIENHNLNINSKKASMNSNLFMRENKFHPNNHLDKAYLCNNNDESFNLNNIKKANNPINIIPQQPKVYINNIECGYGQSNNETKNFQARHSDKDLKFMQNSNFNSYNSNAFYKLNNENIDNFNNYNTGNMNYNNNNKKLDVRVFNNFKSQSAKNTSKFNDPTNYQHGIINNFNHSPNNSNIKFYCNNNLSMFNNNQSNYQNVSNPQSSKFLNFNNPYAYDNHNQNSLQNSIGNKSNQKFYYGSDKCLNSFSHLSINNKNNFNDRNCHGSSTNVTQSPYSMMSCSNDQSMFAKSDEFKSSFFICLNKLNFLLKIIFLIFQTIKIIIKRCYDNERRI